MLDAFEAKRKREPKVTFEIDEWKITGGFYLRATLTDGTVDRIEGFATEGEAAQWIKNKLVFGCITALIGRSNKQIKINRIELGQ